MKVNKILISEWIRYRRSFFFFIYIGILIGLPFLLKLINIDPIDETLLLIVITLTITVLAATEIPRLTESGIIRPVLLSNVTRQYFYLSQLFKYLTIYCCSFLIGIISLQLVLISSFSFEWIARRFFVYLIITLFYVSFSQLLSVIFRRTVESLMSSILIIFVIIPILNSFFTRIHFIRNYLFYIWNLKIFYY
ncbi:hypothetical protein CEW92_11680 [Bacillaceae bacterium SAS-127]|nr:hypothetical protein CEW92_11680 [Bacillaceae bacterium SAS-127]